MNTGNQPVREADYDLPIEFQLVGNIAPIDARVTAQHPDDIVRDIFVTQPNGARTIAIKPRLLNPGYWFKIRMLFNHDDARLEATHRIIGGREMRHTSIDLLRKQIRITRPLFALYPLAFIVGAIVGAVIQSHDHSPQSLAHPVLNLVAMCLLSGVLLATVTAVLFFIGSSLYVRYFYR